MIKMRCNKQDLAALASQNSQSFDREGIMLFKEKQDGFFRRSEGNYSVRWFRLRGNLLFYLKGSEPWQEPVGVIVLGENQVQEQTQDENGYWPFKLIWENGTCYRLATFHEAERTSWLKAIQTAPYNVINSQIVALKENLSKMTATTDITTYRLQKGIVLDMNEVPLCELALSCDNLLCDTYGRPPSPVIVIYVKCSKGLSIKYGTTEIVETCSNPCFSRTILFRASDGLSRETMVRIVVYDVREYVSETAVPMGSTSLQLSTIQEAQRLRTALLTRDNKTVGFVTINGWSLEPSYIGTSPSHTQDRNCVDITQKVFAHRRSQSLPPRFGLKLKFPSYGNLLKQNFVNSLQATYRFHSGLGGDITVHEIMAEPKLCYQIPIQLLDLYIQREKELLEELLSLGDICGPWHIKRSELTTKHMTLLEQYCHSKKCLQQAENAYFKASCKKDDSSLEFAPINLHLQRMWVYNDTLNKSGFHDVITVGAFAVHTHNEKHTGGLIRLVQKAKDITDEKTAKYLAAANKIQAHYDNVVAMRRLRYEMLADMERIVILLQAIQSDEVVSITQVIKAKLRSMLALWEPEVIEKTLAIIGWPNHDCTMDPPNQTLPLLMRLTDQLSTYDENSNCDNLRASSSSSSKDTSTAFDFPTFPSSSFDSCNDHKDSFETKLQYSSDYLNNDERKSWNHSFRSIQSSPRGKDDCSAPFERNKPRHSSLRKNFKTTYISEKESYQRLLDSLYGTGKKKSSELPSLPSIGQISSSMRDNTLTFLTKVGTDVEDLTKEILEIFLKFAERNRELTDEDLEGLKNVAEKFKSSTRSLGYWSRISHAALRIKCEHTTWGQENAALQTRRYMCFSQALATVTAGLLCWLCSAPSDTVVKILTSELGPLCGFEGLLSLYSTEKAMWGDMVVAVEDLQTVVFTLTKIRHSNMSIPQLSGTRDSLNVYIPVSDSLYSKFTNREYLNFTITPVFFNVGINEKATLAEEGGETTPQFQSNNDNLDRLYKYYHKYNKVFPADHVAPNRVSSRNKPLGEVMENLRIAVHKKVPKNVEVLHLAALATRLMTGIRFTSCKSAKDRTGMSVTLEQCSILASEYHLAEHEMKKALSIMRSEGCRRENTHKNIGVRKYAFTKTQVMALPQEYRPPPGTYGATQS